jgi:8-oxo-dGTP pyrophosphatase MutT (NUDIX family)
MTSLSELDRLRELLRRERPGFKVQSLMSPVRDESSRYYNPSKNAKEAAVLLLLYKEEYEWHTVFIKRSQHEKDKHGGQISFPGGRLENNDHSMSDCALRETEEELGINKSSVSIIGELTPLHVYASNHMVFPFVGVVEQKPTFIPNYNEVQKVLPTAIHYFNNDSVVQSMEMDLKGHVMPNVPYYNLNGEVLWGATAMMMAEFLHLWNYKYE